MDAIERSFEPLVNQLPKDYEKFENDLLENILRIFDSEILRTATGDLFGRIYEYFLMKFAMQGAQDNGEFFTPPSLVQTNRECHRAGSRRRRGSRLWLIGNVRAAIRTTRDLLLPRLMSGEIAV